MTASTRCPQVVEPINIDSVCCTCCDTRWWPDVAPRFPEAFICEVCEQWFRTFDRGRAGFPVVGAAKSLRRILSGQDVTAEEFVTDQSAWMLVFASHAVFTRTQSLMEARSV